MTNGEKFKEVFGFGADGSRVIAVNATWWDCEFQNRKPITKADRIRSMTDEKLAELLNNHNFCAHNFDCEKGMRPCRECNLNWLREEVE